MFNDSGKLIRFIAAVLIPPVAGAGFVYLSAVIFGEYGFTLFIFVPIVMGFVSTVIYAPRGGAGYGMCLLVSLHSVLVIGFLLIFLAIEGMICLLMSLPLAIPLIALGSLLGYVLTNYYKKAHAGTAVSLFLVGAMPLLLGFETSTKSKPTLHEVVSTVEIDAPIEKIWQNVVAFPQIDKQPEGILKLGFAYPINARIDGSGVGAMRYCNFNTGAFVEPITAWQEPNLLAFDVKEQPAPMTEMSPYEHLHAAHLEYIRSQRGQFRLYEKDGKTVVEGTTFYTHEIAPDIYWNLFSDEIIHQIHMRVLNHIKEVSEK